MPDSYSLQVGFTPPSPCSYLKEQQQRLAIIMEASWHSSDGYNLLLANGYRRTGKNIYRPMCEKCRACQSLRVDCEAFTPSRSQKRLLNKTKHLRWEMKTELDDNWFELYSDYITIRHATGSMFPPNKTDFLQFIQVDWCPTQYLHIYDQERLIAVAVTDTFSDSASALYTFFSPDSSLSLGTMAVLLQLEWATSCGKKWLYLGFQIDQCREMNYKVNYSPYQLLSINGWITAD
ncbi:arginyltransferase [Vibrio sp. SS-MA-C1-2]|uniref:arginyltransferase n=1 Tax=Vibrio sp. SS-MA-C1-2 TaxID=2908646 RepID=UPI001F2DF741|nr:arginyltransferase [Vibrio sp. SS-MA-C1-2]UJF19884.1 arginyltransferase [Vibrio sp. SS-MA-C1-2]